MPSKKYKFAPGDLVRLRPKQSCYSAVHEIGDGLWDFFDILPDFLMTYVRHDYFSPRQSADVVLYQGKLLHVSEGVLRRVVT
jgi:hypothetical protein